MDGDDQRRKQYGPPSYPLSSPATTTSVQQGAFQPVDRFSQLTTTRVESSRPTMGRASNVAGFASGYGYSEQQPYQAQPLQGGSLQYQPGFSQAVARGQQPQQLAAHPSYPQYGGAVMYNLPQQAPSQSQFETIPQYQQRQSAAIEVLSTQFGVPQYFTSNEPTAAGMTSSHAPYIASQAETGSYPHQTPTRGPSGTQSYPMEMDYSPMVPSNAPEQQQVLPSSENVEETFNRYQQQLRTALESINAGRLVEAGEQVLSLSQYLVTQVSKLGLDQDGTNPLFDAIQLWKDFNLCWLALGQKQKDVVEETLRYRTQPTNVLSAEAIQGMAEELIRLCDTLEQYGLVDYDRGIWEEEILGILSHCLDILRPGDEISSEVLPPEVSGRPP